MQQATKAKVYILPEYSIDELSRNPHPKPISTVSNERIQQHTDANPPTPPCSALPRLHPITPLSPSCCSASLSTFPSHTPLSSPFIRPSPSTTPPCSLILPTSPASALPPGRSINAPFLPLPIEHRKQHGKFQPRAIIVKTLIIIPSVNPPQYNNLCLWLKS